MIKRLTSLSGNIVQFCRFLRQHGFSISVEEESTTLQALGFIDYTRQHHFQIALKTVLCKTPNEREQFDNLFEEYWKQLEKAVDSKSLMPRSKNKVKEPSFQALKLWLHGNNKDSIEHTASYSIHENISHKDFSSIPVDQVEEVKQIIRSLSKRLAAKLKHRYKPTHYFERPDLRRTLRKNLRHGGELLELAFKKPIPDRRKLVLLCDVSKSMDLYSVFLLQFMFAFQHVFRRTETFVFSTSLHRITQVLRNNDFNSSLQQLSTSAETWGSGTRIGESLQQFSELYASRYVDKKSIVIILSDGWDTGEPGLIGESMKKIHNKCRKLIWLNPLAGSASFRPEVAGLKSALAYIDVLAPFHNVDSLRTLARYL